MKKELSAKLGGTYIYFLARYLFLKNTNLKVKIKQHIPHHHHHLFSHSREFVRKSGAISAICYLTTLHGGEKAVSCIAKSSPLPLSSIPSSVSPLCIRMYTEFQLSSVPLLYRAVLGGWWRRRTQKRVPGERGRCYCLLRFL